MKITFSTKFGDELIDTENIDDNKIQSLKLTREKISEIENELNRRTWSEKELIDLIKRYI